MPTNDDVARLIARHGEKVEIRRATATPGLNFVARVRAHLKDGAPEALMAGRFGDERIATIAAGDGGWATFPAPPVATDLLVADGQVYVIHGVERRDLHGEAALYVMTIRRD